MNLATTIQETIDADPRVIIAKVVKDEIKPKERDFLFPRKRIEFAEVHNFFLALQQGRYKITHNDLPELQEILEKCTGNLLSKETCSFSIFEHYNAKNNKPYLFFGYKMFERKVGERMVDTTALGVNISCRNPGAEKANVYERVYVTLFSARELAEQEARLHNTPRLITRAVLLEDIPRYSPNYNPSFLQKSFGRGRLAVEYE